MISKSLMDQWKKDEKAPFSGWDFSYLKGRWEEEQPGWNYEALARRLVKESKSVLDMATGGGEIFSSFAPFQGRAVGIEGYRPNVAVARKRLRPLGVSVIEASDSGVLPFKNGEFDLVLNRHGAFMPSEIARILKRRGLFLTQQVSGDSLTDLMSFFGVKPQWPDNVLKKVKRKVLEAGLKIKKADEWAGQTKFFDLGALVYFLKAVPWIVDGFSIRAYMHELMKLQKILEKEKVLRFKAKRFFILVEKP